MKHATIRAQILCAAFTLLSPVGWAASELMVGETACLTLKSARNYAQYAKEAPAFAADLLARASCYQLKESAAAVPQGRPEQGFQAYKVLSGHRVWVPVRR